jgi:polyvinyl alcohol dehydrogenase (cytochrome)
MYSAGRSSFNPDATAITPTNAASVALKWRFSPSAGSMPGQPPPHLYATPVTVNGVVYVGADSGYFYAVNAATGQELWRQFLGYTIAGGCAHGVDSTAAVAADPASGANTVYVGGGDGNVYALDAADGHIRWKTLVAPRLPTQNQPFLWSSPAVARGRVYMGIASLCGNYAPVAGSGVVALDQTSGAPLAAYLTEPPGGTGAAVWSSPAVDPNDGSVFVTTGNAGQTPDLGDAASIVRLDGSTLARLDKWTVPAAEQSPNGDFGASPVLFTAPGYVGPRTLVGACNKNGIFYAFHRNALAAGPIWQRRMSVASTDPPACIGGAAFDGTHLYVGANATTINGTSYAGSLRALRPSNGTPVWATALPEAVLGGPTVNKAGVVAANPGFFSQTGTTRLFNAATGATLRTLPTGFVFGQPVWANNMLIVATVYNGVQAYGPP